ncbi:GDSL-type esterase/lipase family protein [Streptomyces sp. NPDC018045]|uniref:GDSL-type esterase/lipase family protein n=1 Tax=Streptomyces sp. NPDC018045 TaxID=3365037 RepID=UPI0037B8F91A
MRPKCRTSIAGLVTVAAIVATGGCATTTSPTLQSERAGHAVEAPRWTATWGASMQQAVPNTPDEDPNWSEEGFENQTVRQVVRVSTGGDKLRIRLSNAYGGKPLKIAGASVARSDGGAKTKPGSQRPLTFGGSLGTTIPAGKDTVSDTVPLEVAHLEKLAVSLRFTGPTGRATFHRFTTDRSYRADGDRLTEVGSGAFTESTNSWYYLSAVDVQGEAARPRDAVLVFGDSLIDGVGSTPGADNRFSDKLAERLVAAHRPLGLANAGLAGARLLEDSPCFGEKAAVRFERELEQRSGLRTAIVHLGANDLSVTMPGTPCANDGPRPTLRQLIDGHRELIKIAHAKGVKAVGMTLVPIRGAVFPFADRAGDRLRRQLNDWIRDSGAYDSVLDTDRILADASQRTRPSPAYVSEDGLHPNDTGYFAVAAAVDLDLL